VWLTKEDQSSLHCVIVSADVMSDHVEHREASRVFQWNSVLVSILSSSVTQCRKFSITACKIGPLYGHLIAIIILHYLFVMPEGNINIDTKYNEKTVGLRTCLKVKNLSIKSGLDIMCLLFICFGSARGKISVSSIPNRR